MNDFFEFLVAKDTPDWVFGFVSSTACVAGITLMITLAVQGMLHYVLLLGWVALIFRVVWLYLKHRKDMK